MGIESTDEEVDLSPGAGTVDGAEDTAADPVQDGAANGAASDAGEATGSEATTGTDATAEGAGAAPSEAAERKLAPAGQKATSDHRPTNAGQPPKAGQKPAATGAAAAPADPVKQFNDEKAAWGRERATYEKQQRELAERVKQFEQGEQTRKAEAERLALKAWHPQHPSSAQAMARIGRVKAYLSALNAVPPEAQTPELKANMARQLGVTNEDAKLHDEYQAHRDDVVNRLASDPEGFLDQRVSQTVPRLIQEAFNQFFAHQRAQADVQQMMADPAKIAPHADMIRERLTGGSKLSDVMELVDLKNRLFALEGAGGAVVQKDAAVARREKATAERERLSKGAAAITRDQKVAGKPDFYSQALKEAASRKGDKAWQPGGSKFNRHLAELEEAHRGAAVSE